MDINTACTSFLYGLSSAAAMVRTGAVRNAVVIGVELISPYMDWTNRGVAVLFGDGCAAVVLQATDEPGVGLLGEQLGCYADARQTLRVRGMGCTYANRGQVLGDTQWDFDGQEIFKRAVHGMGEAAASVMAKCGVSPDEVDLVVPHQANLRISQYIQEKLALRDDQVYNNIMRYGNTTAASIPIALSEAWAEGRMKENDVICLAAFGSGFTWASALIRW